MQMRVQVVIDTDELLRWAAKHRELGHETVAEVLTLAATHYAGLAVGPTEATDPSSPVYPATADAVELRYWAEWHADRAPAGVAHVLYEAAAAASHR